MNCEKSSTNKSKVNTITWDSVPTGFTFCVVSDCPLASQCLRAIAYSLVPEDRNFLMIANPQQCTKADGCPHYKSSGTVKNAYGFTKIRGKLTNSQFRTFEVRLQGKFTRTGYFRRRKGERPIPPAEQDFIKKVLADIGAPSTCDFDAYRTEYVWQELKKTC